MDNNRLDGMKHEAKGAIKEHVGQATGDRSLEVEGNAEEHAGKAEQMIDAISDRMRTSEHKR
ncbi:MAG: CsbD-like protein [Xanthomonadaceae bacterium]|nr:CsbD-like protein [Xanthomonadaceae bacterium]